MNKCDVCGVENNNVMPGRWIFYCPKHKDIDRQKTIENEIAPDLANGNFDYIADDSELQDIMIGELQ